MKPTLAVLVGLLLASTSLGQQPKPDSHRAAVDKGLAWLVKQQRADGSFARAKGENATAITGVCGLALLMEGSTLSEGKYAAPLRKAAAWLVKHSQKDGLIGEPKEPSEAGRYMYGHGFAMLFLASVYADEADPVRRRELKDVLTRGVQFNLDARSKHGGWFYTSAKEGHDSEEPSVTLCQIQALQAAHLAGIAVPREMLKKALWCQQQMIPRPADVMPTLRPRQDRPSLTAGAIACAFTAADYKSEHVKKWLNYCERSMPINDRSFGFHDAYTQFYYAQVLYALGENGHETLIPDAKEKLRWSDFRAKFFGHALKTQKDDGSWGDGQAWGAGPIYTTTVYLTILQMENEAVPIFAAKVSK